jgi:hypothetical protein
LLPRGYVRSTAPKQILELQPPAQQKFISAVYFLYNTRVAAPSCPKIGYGVVRPARHKIFAFGRVAPRTPFRTSLRSQGGPGAPRSGAFAFAIAMTHGPIMVGAAPANAASLRNFSLAFACFRGCCGNANDFRYGRVHHRGADAVGCFRGHTCLAGVGPWPVLARRNPRQRAPAFSSRSAAPGERQSRARGRPGRTC